MSVKRIIQGLKFIKIDEKKLFHSTKDCLMIKKYKNVYRALKYIEESLILVFAATNFCFSFIAGIPIGILNSSVELEICVITAGLKRYNSIIKKKRKKPDKTMFLAKG